MIGRMRSVRSVIGVGEPVAGPFSGLGGEVAADRVEVDQGGGPGGLQSCLGASDVAALAGAVAAGEQAEQPLDAGPGSAQVFGGVGVGECLAGGDQEVLVLGEVELAARLAGAARRFQRP